jgi:hypothetical protein
MTTSPNKELKLTKPAFGASQLNSVFDGRDEHDRPALASAAEGRCSGWISWVQSIRRRF